MTLRQARKRQQEAGRVVLVEEDEATWELLQLWEASGPQALDTLRRYDPGSYIRAIAKLFEG